MPPSSYSPSSLSLMIQMKQSGHTWPQIGELFNVSGDQIRKSLKSAFPDLKFPPGTAAKYSEETIKQAVSLKEAGFSFKEIAKELHLPSHVTVEYLIRFRASEILNHRKKPQQTVKNKSPAALEIPAGNPYIKPVTKEQLMSGNARVAKVWKD